MEQTVPPCGIADDRAYIELMSPLPGVMGAGQLLDDDEALRPTTMTDWTGTSMCGSLPRSTDASADTVVCPVAGLLLFKGAVHASWS